MEKKKKKSTRALSYFYGLLFLCSALWKESNFQQRCLSKGGFAGKEMLQHVEVRGAGTWGEGEQRRGQWGPRGRSHSGGEAHLVVAHVVDGVVGPQEDVAEDPQRLPVLGGQVGGLDPDGAVAAVALVGGKIRAGKRQLRALPSHGGLSARL